MGIGVKREKEILPADLSELEVLLSPVPRARKGQETVAKNEIHYQLIHDDIWPVTAQASAGSFATLDYSLPAGTGNDISIWTQIREPFSRLVRSLSKTIAVEEDAAFKSKDWPYAWPRKR